MEYKVTQLLSSREFYRMVDVLNELLNENEIFTLDMTDVMRIDATVIPNLLLLGRFIEEKTGNIPRIRLGENLRSGYLKKYLDGIGFYKLCDFYYAFDNPVGQYGGMIGKNMDTRNTTERFSIEEGPNVAQRRLQYNVYPFIKGYMRTFSHYKNDEELDENIIARFLNEMIDNSFKYGHSDVIVTVQANYKKNRIYLSVSDSGKGFKLPMCQCMDENGQFYKVVLENGKLVQIRVDEEAYNILKKCPDDEKNAAIIGLYKRKSSGIYGLYNLVDKVLCLKGTVRIHSNDIQLILTERWHSVFLQEGIMHMDQAFAKYNLVKTSFFPGTHIEVELPMKTDGGEELGNVRYYE